MDKLKQQITQTLDDCADGLDAATLSRLKQARVKALEQSIQEQPVHWRQTTAMRWLPAGVAATVALLLGINIAITPVTENALPEKSISTLDIATLNEDMELLEQLDFYSWLPEKATYEQN